MWQNGAYYIFMVYILKTTLIPMVECGNTVFYLHSVTPAQRVKFGDVGEFAQGAIGLGAVPLDVAVITHSALDQLS